MKKISVTLPDKIAQQLTLLKQSGWFTNESEIIRRALSEFLRRHRPELIEHFQHEDIAWALQQKATRA